MVAYTKLQQWKKEESEEGYKIKFIDLGSEREHVVGFMKARKRQNVP